MENFFVCGSGTISWPYAVSVHLQKDPLMDCVCVIHVAEALYCVSVHVSNLLIYIYHSKGLRGEHQYTVGLNKRTKKKKKRKSLSQSILTPRGGSTKVGDLSSDFLFKST